MISSGPAPSQSEAGLRIGHIARHCGLTTKTVRYYEEIGLLPVPRRSRSGYRLYDTDDIVRIEFVGAAKDLGFTLSEIRQMLAVRDRGEAPCSYVLGLVRQKLETLHDRIQRLEEISLDLEATVRAADPLSGNSTETGRICHVIERRAAQRHMNRHQHSA